MIKSAFLLLQLLRCSAAFTASSSQPRSWAIVAAPRSPLFMSQWADEDEKEEESASTTPASTSTSFEQAGADLMSQADNDKMSGMGDFDANPQYTEENMLRIKEAIAQRTAALGIGKSEATSVYLKEVEDRAMSELNARKDAGGDGLLDLSQISSASSFSSKQPTKPAFVDLFFDPEDDMTEEEKAESDPVGLLPLVEQIKTEINEAEWPTIVAAIQQVLLLFFIVASTGALIVFFDKFLMDFLLQTGVLPTMDDTNMSEEMILPDGWTSGMSEDDYMNFREEVAQKTSDVVESAKSALEGIVSDL